MKENAAVLFFYYFCLFVCCFVLFVLFFFILFLSLLLFFCWNYAVFSSLMSGKKNKKKKKSGSGSLLTSHALVMLLFKSVVIIVWRVVGVTVLVLEQLVHDFLGSALCADAKQGEDGTNLSFGRKSLIWEWLRLTASNSAIARHHRTRSRKTTERVKENGRGDIWLKAHVALRRRSKRVCEPYVEALHPRNSTSKKGTKEYI